MAGRGDHPERKAGVLRAGSAWLPGGARARQPVATFAQYRRRAWQYLSPAGRPALRPRSDAAAADRQGRPAEPAGHFGGAGHSITAQAPDAAARTAVSPHAANPW